MRQQHTLWKRALDKQPRYCRHNILPDETAGLYCGRVARFATAGGEPRCFIHSVDYLKHREIEIVCRKVITGFSRSYVQDAIQLARYVLEQIEKGRK
jgi:hypothetical protein